MRRIIFIMAMLLVSSCAYAEIHEFKYFSLDVPEGWTSEETGAVVQVKADDDSGSLVIMTDIPEVKSLADIATNFALEFGGSIPEKDEDGNYTFEFNNGRSQAIVTGDEEFYMIIVGNGIENNGEVLGKILESLEMK